MSGMDEARNTRTGGKGYVSGNDTAFVTVEAALRVARDAFDMVRSGYGDYDAIAPQDFDTAQTLGEIIDELQEVEG